MIEIDPELMSNAPPHSKEAEQAVLGSVMLDDRILDDLTGTLEPSDFYYPQHQVIFKTMLGMTGQPIDVVTVSEVMEQHNEGDRVGLDYLIDLADNTPSISNALTYAGIVAERSKERQLVSVGQMFSDLCQDRELTHDDRIQQAQIAFSALSSEKQPSTQVGMKASIEGVLDGLDRRFRGEDDNRQIKTGYSAIDDRIQGFRGGNLILVGARPGMGKTTYATGIAKHAAKHYGKVMIFSLEMPHHELTQRIIACHGSIHMDMIRNPKGLPDEFWPKLTNSVNGVKDLPIVIDDQGGLSVLELASRARRENRKEPIKLIIVDYIQLMNSGNRDHSGNRNLEVGAISMGLKNLAKELDCPVIALSQLNRSLESRQDKRPQPADLRDSGSLEQDADIIQFLYRDEIYNPQTDYKGALEINTAKFRDGCPGVDTTLFIGQYNQITDMDAAKYMQQQEQQNAKKEKTYSPYAKG